MIPIFCPPRLSARRWKRGARRFACGFSLVEVTLAVAVASLAIITLLGLMPQGLEMSRKTSLATSNSSIVEQIIRDLENVKWDDLPDPTSATPTKMLFNDQGVNQTKAGSDDFSFVAEVTVLPAALPKSESTQKFLRRVLIKVAATGNKDFKFEESNRLSYVTYNHLLAKTR